MTYHKPEVVELDSALKAIQGTFKGSVFSETVRISEATVGAYEADE